MTKRKSSLVESTLGRGFAQCLCFWFIRARSTGTAIAQKAPGQHLNPAATTAPKVACLGGPFSDLGERSRELTAPSHVASQSMSLTRLASNEIHLPLPHPSPSMPAISSALLPPHC
ncbi:hypothetical protein CI102_9369 [Trichoderma harzianum]|nr:hypothetical protein CI102_9369 [Trichoderma harzianum]